MNSSMEISYGIYDDFRADNWNCDKGKGRGNHHKLGGIGGKGNPGGSQKEGIGQKEPYKGTPEQIEEHKIQYVKDNMKCSNERAKEVKESLDKYFETNTCDENDVKNIDEFVRSCHPYKASKEKPMYRGMQFSNERYNQYAKTIKQGAIIDVGKDGKPVSFTSEISTANKYGKIKDKKINSVIIKCINNHSATPVANLSEYGKKQNEVLGHSKTKHMVIGMKQNEKNGKRTMILVTKEV